MENKEFKFINIERKGKVAIIKLNRPDKKNALSEAMRTEIIEALDTLKDEVVAFHEEGVISEKEMELELAMLRESQQGN